MNQNEKTSKRRLRVGLIVLFALLFLMSGLLWAPLRTRSLIQCLNCGTGHVSGSLWRRWAAFSLGIVKADPQTVVPALLPHLKDKDESVREMAALSLKHIGQYPELVVPAVLEAWASEPPESIAPIYYAGTISVFGTNARPWSPVLVKWIGTNDFGWWKDRQMWTLAKIDPEAARPLFQLRGGVYSNMFWEMENHPRQPVHPQGLPLSEEFSVKMEAQTNVPPSFSKP